MSQKSEGLVVEEKTVESAETIPVEEVEKVVVENEKIASLDWTPLINEKMEVHAEEIMSGIMERIPGLTVRTSKNNHQVLSFGEKRGRVCCKVWFCKSKVCIETPVLEGRKYKVGQSRYLNEKNGLSRKDRASILKEIKAYIEVRGWES